MNRQLSKSKIISCIVIGVGLAIIFWGMVEVVTLAVTTNVLSMEEN